MLNIPWQAPEQAVRILSADIGGTNTRLAVFEVQRDMPWKTLDQQVYPSASSDSLEKILHTFQERNGLQCTVASIGLAGPVRGRKSRTTNLPWLVDAASLEKEMGYQACYLMNDLEANAYGISALPEEDIYVLSAGEPDPEGNSCIIAAGTGLGEAGMYWDGRSHRPFASEGGHASFGPADDVQWHLLQFLQRRFGHVSWERVVSGPGLVNVYEFLLDHHKVTPPDWLQEAIIQGKAAAMVSKNAVAESDEISVEALDLFIRLYGAEAGNHGLKLMATAGVYVGGGIAPKILDRIRHGGFLHAMGSKGRMSALVEKMPVYVIRNDQTALMGPVVFALMQ